MISFTERAREMVLQFMGNGQDDGEALRIAMNGSPLSPRFDLTLVTPDERRDDEREFDGGGFTVLVAEQQAGALEGAVVDFVERVNESGFEVRPKPQSATVEATPADGALATRVQELLDAQVNPAIAAHGGVISLAEVRGGEVYLEMSGGCQGCAMSRLTLRQGVERMLRQALPEITAVHDVTDHASGENPYF